MLDGSTPLINMPSSWMDGQVGRCPHCGVLVVEGILLVCVNTLQSVMGIVRGINLSVMLALTSALVLVRINANLLRVLVA